MRRPVAVKVGDIFVKFTQCLVNCAFPLTNVPMFHFSLKNTLALHKIQHIIVQNTGESLWMSLSRVLPDCLSIRKVLFSYYTEHNHSSGGRQSLSLNSFTGHVAEFNNK